MSSFLICIGSAAERSLPVVFTALSCGAALPVSFLRVFCFSHRQEELGGAALLAEDLSACCRLTRSAEGASLFPSGFSLDSCVPAFRSLRDLSGDPDTALFISALRGKGQPLSCETDRDAVEWCFSDLLSRPEDPSVQPFFSWLDTVDKELDSDQPFRLTLMADLSDPFSAGIALVLLPFLRARFQDASPFLSLIALEEASPSPSGSFYSCLSSSLRALDDRSILRCAEDESALGADALWLLSLPSSMVESTDSGAVAALAAARILGELDSGSPVPYGLHTVEADGTLSAASLGDQALPFAAFLRTSLWLLMDLFPALRSWLDHPSRFRSLAPNSRNALFRQLFSVSPENSAAETLALLESTLKSLLSNILSFLRSVPPSLRLSAGNIAAWQQAVDACGRYITVASEYDVSSAEARESGLDSVKPVHRVSMADTEEEQLASRLRDMERQLESEEKLREEALSSVGGYRSLQARLDCLSRCRAALKDACLKSESSADGLDHLSVLKRERRVRLLKAAVSRCESELDPDSLQSAVSAPPTQKPAASDPYTNGILDADFCRLLEKWLDQPGEISYAKLPSPFSGIRETDPKMRTKDLLLSCRGAEAEEPFSLLLDRAFRICTEETASLRFPSSAGTLPAVPLLPDIAADSPLQSIQDVLSRLPGGSAADADPSELRGLLAMLLLRQYRRRFSSESSLSVACCGPDSSPVLRHWLSAHRAEKVYILSLESGGESWPFALILPGRAFLAAKRMAARNPLVPSFAVWFDAESGVFSDPCSSVGEGDRLLLLELLASYTGVLSAESGSPLAAFLGAFRDDLQRSPESVAPDRHLKTRLRAACGLLSLPAYEQYISRTVCFYEHFLPSDAIGACLTGREDFPPSICTDIPEEVLYLYRGVPFAREDSRLLLDSPHATGEEYTLSRLKTECENLYESSDDYRDALQKHLKELLDRTPSALPEVSKTALSVLKEAGEPLGLREPVFTWPWDPKSPSMLSILRESLGTGVLDTVLEPFSDRLCLFPARTDIIGDSLLSSMCTVLPVNGDPAVGSAVSPDAVLPPLSPGFGRVLCASPEGRTLLKPGLLSFERFREEAAPSDSFRVTLTLDGVFPVRFVRNYSPDEVLHLYSHDIPTLALWPSVPFPPGEWNAYYVYAHMKPVYTVSVLSASGEYTPLQTVSENRCAAEFSSFPVCFSFSFENHTAGLIPNVLPSPLLQSSVPAEICVDFGSAGTSVVFSSGRRRYPMHGPVMVRTLLNNPSSSRDLLRREFLPAVPVSALLPTVSRLFRNVPGAAPVPFEDGIVLMSSGLEDLLSTPSDAIYTSLKWEEEKGRSGFVCLHQVLLMAALQARFEGAPSVSWRFALPDEMAQEGRETLMNLFLALCESVLRKSGYPVPAEGLPVAFASESSALGAYFRFCASDDTRGGFMVLDLGACTADISLFMRGREQAVRTCQLPLGVHYMLLPSLLRDPDLLSADFGFCTEESFRRDLILLTRALSAARSDPVALRRARAALDYFIADHLPLLVQLEQQLSAAGRPSRFCSLLLLHFAYLLMLSGLVLLQLASDPNKNDFLPEQMALCLSGRGAALLEALPPQQKASLWRFLSMFRSRRVVSLSLLFSAEKKMEIPVGLSLLQNVYHMLPPSSSIPASVSARPAEFLPEFLLRFRREFPASAELLFSGFFTDDYYHPFTDRGEALLSASIDQSFRPSEPPRPYDSLSAWIGNLLDLIRS